MIASIATASFGGAHQGALQGAVVSLFSWLVDAGFGLTAALRVSSTIFLALVFVGVALVYLIGVRGMRTVAGAPSLATLRSGLRAHPDPDRLRLSGRPLLQPLRLPGAGPVPPPSSPTPLGGNAARRPLRRRRGRRRLRPPQPQRDLVPSSELSLVAGHVAGLTLAHDRALVFWPDYRLATHSRCSILSA